MKKVISVRFKDNGKTYYFDPADTPIKTGDYVIVETARGVECGEVVQGVKEIADSAVPKALKPITRWQTGCTLPSCWLEAMPRWKAAKARRAPCWHCIPYDVKVRKLK